MSLIHTCELNGVPSLGYLIALQKHAQRGGRTTLGLDAMELSRDSRTPRIRLAL